MPVRLRSTDENTNYQTPEKREAVVIDTGEGIEDWGTLKGDSLFKEKTINDTLRALHDWTVEWPFRI